MLQKKDEGMIYIVVLLASLCMPISLHAISMVYNFRIAQITKQPLHDNPNLKNHTFIALPFDLYQKKYNDIVQNFAGSLGAFIYNYEPYYARVDAAVSHVYQHGGAVPSFSDVQTDDILCTVGRNFEVNQRNTITLSGLFGVPTHQVLRLKHVDFGYGQVGTGIQLDGSYAFHHENAFLWGARYIYFIPRHATDTLHHNYKFTIGNVADVLLAYKQNWNKHGIECGYTNRVQFGSAIHPYVPDLATQTNYIRNSVYAVYKYKFFIRDMANRLLFNISYGFENKNPVHNRQIFTFWGSWSINF
jgi:hypothetical protein